MAARRTPTMKIERIVSTRLPTPYGEFAIHGFREGDSGQEHVVLSLGDLAGQPGDEPPLVRVHSECLTGDVFGSRRCDCGEQLDLALQRVAEAGRGVVIYVRGHEGRAIGLVNTSQHTERDRDIVDVPGQRTWRIEGQRQRHDTVPTDESVSRLEAHNTGGRGGIPNRSTCVGADANDRKSRSHRNPGAARRSQGRAREIVRVPHLAAKRAARNARREL